MHGGGNCIKRRRVRPNPSAEVAVSYVTRLEQRAEALPTIPSDGPRARATFQRVNHRERWHYPPNQVWIALYPQADEAELED